MKATGKIEIEKGLILTNPTMESRGVKKAYDINEETEEETFLYDYVEVIFKEHKEKIRHSRNYELAEGQTEANLIANNKVLKQFK